MQQGIVQTGLQVKISFTAFVLRIIVRKVNRKQILIILNSTPSLKDKPFVICSLYVVVTG